MERAGAPLADWGARVRAEIAPSAGRERDQHDEAGQDERRLADRFPRAAAAPCVAGFAAACTPTCSE